VDWLHGNNVVQQLSENIVLYDLAQIRGIGAILNRIPENTGGVYAWYHRFEIDDSAVNDPETFVKYILDELCKAHSIPRETKLKGL